MICSFTISFIWLYCSSNCLGESPYLFPESKQKRKVLLVEHPNKKAAVKNVNSVRNSTNNSRPLSADDIQKAKMRAMFMQEKYGKVDSSKASDKSQVTETPKTSGLVNSNVSPVPRDPLRSNAQPVDPSMSTLKQSIVPQSDKPENSNGLNLDIGSPKNVVEKLDSKRVPWRIPPGIFLLCAPPFAILLNVE